MHLGEFQDQLKRLTMRLPPPSGDSLNQVVARARRRVRRRRTVVAMGVAAVFAALAVPVGYFASKSSPQIVRVGSGTSLPSAKQRSGVAIEVSPTSSRFDEPIDTTVTGLRPGELVTIHLRSIDAKGVLWVSAGTFRAGRSGSIDANQDPALGGSYRGAIPMGLIDSMAPADNKKADLQYFWKLKPSTFQVSVVAGGKTVAETDFSRGGRAPGVKVHDETIAGTGFYGQYWTPPPGTPRHPGLLAFGGSGLIQGLDGPLLGAALASAGYPTLNIAYFGEPGLPSTLKDIPLSYFARALTWLSHQPQVNPKEIYTLGGSRGGEAALLLGAYYPNLVHGVIAATPSQTVLGSTIFGSAAWTFDGKPIPKDSQIPVQKIKGPVFLDCGTSDNTSDSCSMAQDIQQQLSAAHDPSPHVLYQYQGAGAIVELLIPYQPRSPAFNTQYKLYEGVNPFADNIALANLWPHLMAFLANPTNQTGTTTINATGPAQ